MVCTASRTMVVLSTAVSRAGCTRSARSCGPTISATPFALTSAKVPGHLTMFWNACKSKSLLPCAAISIQTYLTGKSRICPDFPNRTPGSNTASPSSAPLVPPSCAPSTLRSSSIRRTRLPGARSSSSARTLSRLAIRWCMTWRSARCRCTAWLSRRVSRRQSLFRRLLRVCRTLLLAGRDAGVGMSWVCTWCRRSAEVQS